ncbi:RIO1 family [Fragilaria crotonensis]|nr:RIO1 family [Fragilaria crotonensis]
MNPLTRGIHKNLDSKSYHRMPNEFDDAASEAPPVQGRLRLGSRRKKSGPEPFKSPSHAHDASPGAAFGVDRNDELLHQSWTGEFPSEFSSRHEPMQRRLKTDAESIVSRGGDESLLSHGESTDVAVRPTISKPAPQRIDHHHRHQKLNNHAKRAGPATIISTNSLESMDKVEKASITSPGIHCQQWNRNRMSKQRMLSEKTINTINTQGTMNTNTTTGTGMHTVTTADSTLLSSIASLQSVTASAMVAPTSEFSATSPGMGNSARNSLRNDQDNYSPNESMTLRHVTLPKHRKPNRGQSSDRQEFHDRSLSDTTPSPIDMSPDADETEEDRMMRLAMEMSLRDFEEQRQLVSLAESSGKRQPVISTPRKRQLQGQELRSPRPTHSQQQRHHHRSTVMQSPSHVEQEELRSQLHQYERQSSQQSLLTAATKDEFTEVLVENRRGIQRNLRSSRNVALAAGPEKPSVSTTPNAGGRTHWNGSNVTCDPSVARQLEFARAHLTKDEADAIERALLGDDTDGDIQETTSCRPSSFATVQQPTQENRQQLAAACHLSDAEAAEIEKAIREADEEEQKRSISLALRVSAEEAIRAKSVTQQRLNGASGSGASHRSPSPPRTTQTLFHPSHERSPYPTMKEQGDDRNGVNTRQETIDRFIRVNDVDSETDEEMLGMEADEDIDFAGNTAYNAFTQPLDRTTSVNKESNLPARTSSDAVSSSEVRLRNQIASAVRSGLIEHCNGVVKQGEEAAVYHADQGAGSNGYDVAIKVFQRMKGSKIRSMMGDPRYYPRSSRNNISCTHEELILRAEREYRNLIRASRAHVPVASPLLQKENLVFMRFMGEDGWPAPQLKEVELRKGSKGWCLLYSQIMVAVRRLYITARLVHADLNEYNILVCPSNLVEHKSEDASMTDDGEQFQAVLIDFVQSVDVNHPQAAELLERDLEHIRAFFFKKGIKTLGRHMAIEFVTAPDPDAYAREKTTEESVVEKDLHKIQTVDAPEPVEHVATSAIEPVSEQAHTSFKSHSPSLNTSSVSTVTKGDATAQAHLNQSARTIGGNSHSTKSSFSSTSSAHKSTSLKQPSRNVSVNLTATSAVSGSHVEGSGSKTPKKEKKEKKAHKEKKEKKKKKDKDSTKESSSGKRKIKDSQQEPGQAMMEQSMLSTDAAMMEQSMFPNGVESSTLLFSDSLDEFAATFEIDNVDWHAEWDDDVLEG